MTPAVQRRILVGLTLSLLPALSLVGVWRLGGVSALEDDLIYYLPVRQYIAERIWAGEWPTWNPQVAMGTSIAADPQSGLWYPATALFLLLPPLVAYPVSLWLHFIVAGTGMYRFLRACRHDGRAALVGAVAFEFCGYLVAHRAHLTIHHATAWLPWMLYGWSRFSQTGRMRHAALAAAAFGLQMLVQHIQVSIISAVLVTGYVSVVLLPRRRSLAWAYPVAMLAGTMMSGVQLVPTWLHFAGSVRGAPSYYLFNENAWVPRSGLLLLFPMLFGSRTPNLWAESWWGDSHFCEQSAYATIMILLLAAASFRLAKVALGNEAERCSRRRCAFLLGSGLSYARRVWSSVRTRGVWVGAPEGALLREDRFTVRFITAIGCDLRSVGRRLFRGWRREPAFWWWASLAALLIALGDLTPLGRLLFHLPFYRSLRVPARWILVWSVAMPVLASMTLSAVLRSSAEAARLLRSIRSIVCRALPIVVVGLLVLPVLPDDGNRPWPRQFLFSLMNNPSLWWSILVMMATGASLLYWLRTRSNGAFGLLFGVFLVDIFSVVPFVDVDTRTYSPRELSEPPPLARAIHERGVRPGDRLLVPRCSADYHRLIEVLWPQSNLRAGIATINGYGPLGPIGGRLLFRFMPWGSSEEMLALLRNRRLLRSAGVRFIAVRSEEERSLLAAAIVPASAAPLEIPIPAGNRFVSITYGDDLIWGPIAIPRPGQYELSFDVEPVTGSTSRWFVRLETPAKVEIDRTRTIEPADMSLGARRMRFLYRFEDPLPELMIRVKSEIGRSLSAGRASLRQIADAAAKGQPMSPDPFIHVADLPGGISLYELPETQPLLYWPDWVETVPSLAVAIDHLERSPLRGPTLVETPGGELPAAARSRWPIQMNRLSGHEVRASVESSGGLLVFNESYDAGWRASVDGRAVALLRTNGIAQAVMVPGGKHEVRFQYWQRGLRLGAGLSIAGAMVILAALVLSPWITRRRSARPWIN